MKSAGSSWPSSGPRRTGKTSCLRFDSTGLTSDALTSSPALLPPPLVGTDEVAVQSERVKRRFVGVSHSPVRGGDGSVWLYGRSMRPESGCGEREASGFGERVLVLPPFSRLPSAELSTA